MTDFPKTDSSGITLSKSRDTDWRLIGTLGGALGTIAAPFVLSAGFGHVAANRFTESDAIEYVSVRGYHKAEITRTDTMLFPRIGQVICAQGTSVRYDLTAERLATLTEAPAQQVTVNLAVCDGVNSDPMIRELKPR